jgi:glycosyltransferase involved in cell wall biosynthesis
MKARAAREQEMLAMTRHVIGRTSWDRRVTRVLAPGSQYHVFEESLRESFYQQQWAKKQFDKPVQLVSTMTEGLYKGLETVVKTARILKKTGLAYTWTIVGQKETNSFPRIVKRWLKTDFASLDIHLVGGKNEGEVASILANADIYCHVSHIENSPNSPCEAMVMGVPVIATMAGGTDTTMNGGNLGLMIQDGDPYSLAGAILEVLGDFDAARLRGQVARAFALNRHDKHKNVATLLDIYKTMTAGSLK